MWRRIFSVELGKNGIRRQQEKRPHKMAEHRPGNGRIGGQALAFR
jgi:hypothetical protein